MSLKYIQDEVDAWTKQFVPQYWTPHEIMVRLTEENGEIAREINHLYGPKRKKPTEEKNHLELEIGDLIFTLTCLANSQNISLDQAFRKTMEKYKARDADRFEKK